MGGSSFKNDGSPTRLISKTAIKKDDKMLFGIGCFTVGSIAVIAIAYIYLKQMSDEMMK